MCRRTQRSVIRRILFRREIWPKNRKAVETILYFIVGGIVVVVALLAFLYMGGHLPGQSSKVSVTVEAPKVSP
jgi:hypothetical protein